jgi:hypothetical protein
MSMSNDSHDPLGEVHQELDQLLRVSIAGLLQLSEIAARRGAKRAGGRRDEQVALAKAAGAQLEADYAGTPYAATAAREATLAGEPAPPGTTTGRPVGGQGQREAPGAATGEGQTAVPTDGTGTGLGSDGRGPLEGALLPPVAVPGTVASLLSRSHPLPARQDLAAAAAAGAKPGHDQSAGARRLGAAQPVELADQVGLG